AQSRDKAEEAQSRDKAVQFHFHDEAAVQGFYIRRTLYSQA
ncbi:43091_t:CDS:1, partial [Gigaspora margarita]